MKEEGRGVGWDLGRTLMTSCTELHRSALGGLFSSWKNLDVSMAQATEQVKNEGENMNAKET